MVEKMWACPKCHYVAQEIPAESKQQPCPKCGYPLKLEDYIHEEEDLKAWQEDLKRESSRFGSLKSVEKKNEND